jgi:hypothetical protein
VFIQLYVADGSYRIRCYCILLRGASFETICRSEFFFYNKTLNDTSRQESYTRTLLPNLDFSNKFSRFISLYYSCKSTPFVY